MMFFKELVFMAMSLGGYFGSLLKNYYIFAIMSMMTAIEVFTGVDALP